MRKRIFSFILAAAMVVSQMGTTVWAEDVQDSGTNGVNSSCEHHTEHNEECGYVEGTPEVPCDMGCTDTDDDGEIDHADGCSYSPAVEGSPCIFDPANCEQCKQSAAAVQEVQQLIDALPAVEQVQEMTKAQQQEVYDQLQAAFEAYEALSEKEKERLIHLEVFESLFDLFNSQLMTLEGDHIHEMSVDCAETGNTITFEAWDGTDINFTDSDKDGVVNLYLTDDVELSNVITCNYGPDTTVNLCLNGHVLKGSGSHPVIRLASRTTLNLCDCGKTQHKFTPNRDGLWVLDEANGTETLTGGVITGGVSPSNSSLYYGNGGGIFVGMQELGATFHMYGGNIVGNHAPGNGGGVYVVGGDSDGSGTQRNASFYMHGGAIVGNTAGLSGGGVSASSMSKVLAVTTFEMSGNAVVRNNTAGLRNSSGYGGGVRLEGGSNSVAGTADRVVFKMSDNAAILNNHHLGDARNVGGGGLYVGPKSEVTLTGNIDISGNTQGSAGEPSNLYLALNRVVSVDENLDPVTPIGVRSRYIPDEKKGIKVTDFQDTNDYSDRFTADESDTYHLENVPDITGSSKNYSVQILPGGTTGPHTHCICGGSLSVGDHTSHTDITYDTEWSGTLTDCTIAMSTPVVNAVLTGDTLLSRSLSIRGEEDTPVVLNLCLNGHQLKLDNQEGSVIRVQEYATLNLCDCNSTNKTYYGQWDANYTTYTISENPPSGEYDTLTGGVITGGTENPSAGNRGGISLDHYSSYIYNGTLNMYGGNVAGNFSTRGGGISSIDPRNTVNLYGGSIIGNRSSGEGGGVSLEGTMNFYGGEVTNNRYEGSYNGGGGIAVKETGKLTMTGGKISRNAVSSGTIGGGVYVQSNAYNKESGVFRLSGGEILENEGGGVAVTTSISGRESDPKLAAKLLLSGSAKIDGNTRNGKEQNLYLEDLAVAEIVDRMEPSSIGVSTGGRDTVFTSGWTDRMGNAEISDYFTADNEDQIILEGKELKIPTYEVTLKDNLKVGDQTGVVKRSKKAKVTISGESAAGGIIVTKTGGLDTVPADDAGDGKFSFVMPGYPVTVTAVSPVAPEHTHDMSVKCGSGSPVDFSAWDGTGAFPGGNIYLSSDVTLTDSLSVTGAVNLCLNGHKLALANGVLSKPVIHVEQGAFLRLCDCAGDSGSHTITDPATGKPVTIANGLITGAKRGNTAGSNPGILVDGTLNLYGGTIAGNEGRALDENSGSPGGGVYLAQSGASFAMYGGEICCNTAGNGGGVHAVPGASFTMAGGKISGNNALSGGGIFSDGEASLSAGEISGNHAATAQGGGVCIMGGTLALSGGEITGNTAAGNGGGLFVVKSSTVTLSGSPIVTGNRKGTEGNNLHLPTGSTVLVGAGGLRAGAKFGVTTTSVPTAESPVAVTGANSADASGYFSSDNSDYEIQDGDGHVVQLAATESTEQTASVISIGELPSSMAGKLYHQTLTASGTKPITWRISDGKLPEGLTLDSTTGVISGTPAEEGTFFFTITASNAAGSAQQALSIQVVDDTYDISGEVMDNQQPVEGATVTLMRGGKPVDGVASVITTADGKYRFTGMVPGFYNVKAEKDGKFMTILVELTDGNAVEQNISLPEEKKNSEVKVENGVPAIVAGGVEQVAAGQDIPQGSTSITIALHVAPETKQDNQTPVASFADQSGKEIGLYLDIRLMLQVDQGNPTDIGGSNHHIIEIKIPFDTSKSGITVYRTHDGITEALSNSGSGERYEIGTGMVTIYASKFSTYAIGYNKTGGSTGDGSTGDGSTGDGSTGDGSTGDGSTGDGSTGDGSTGGGSTGGGSTGGGSTGGSSTGGSSTGGGSSSGGASYGNDSSYRNDEHAFWKEVQRTIEDAKPGDTVKVNARGYDRLPARVMDALRKSEAITLVITWNGGKKITIPYAAALNESNRIFYPLSYLAGMEFETPAHDPSKLNPTTGGVWEVTAPIAVDHILTPAGTPEITHPQRGLAETSELAEQGVEKNIPNIYESETTPISDSTQTGGSGATALQIFLIAAAAAMGGIWFWKYRKA